MVSQNIIVSHTKRAINAGGIYIRTIGVQYRGGGHYVPQKFSRVKNSG